jgi:hypothetical protein
VLFDHEYVVKFLKRHEKFMEMRSIIMVFIYEKKFKLASRYLALVKKEDFTVEFFTLALRSGAYYLAVYLYSKYENEVVYEHNKSVAALLDVYLHSNKHIKAKLHVTYVLLPIFSFGEAKAFL